MLNNCGINKVFLLGVINKEPRWHKNSQGIEVLCFTLLTQEDIGKNGSIIEHFETHMVKVPNKNTTDLNLKKGQTVHIEGKVQTTAFTDEQQIRRYKTEIIALRTTIVSQPGVNADAVLSGTKINQL